VSAKTAAKGTGPGGRITPDDIKAKAGELAGGVEDDIKAVRPTMTYAAVGAGLVVVLVAFWLGRRSGRRKSTVVEIRRG
jgi:hypothetical protein